METVYKRQEPTTSASFAIKLFVDFFGTHPIFKIFTVNRQIPHNAQPRQRPPSGGYKLGDDVIPLEILKHESKTKLKTVRVNDNYGIATNLKKHASIVK